MGTDSGAAPAPLAPMPPVARLSKGAMAVRVGVIAVVVGGLAVAFAYAGGWLTPHALTPFAMIDRFEQVNGVHSGFRRNHAKGVCFAGYFESNGNGVTLSKAKVFEPGRTPVIGRFALAGGNPYVTDAPHTTRSMAVLFELSSGEEWRTGMNNIPVFAAATAQAFYDQILASAPDPDSGKPNATKMQAFFEKYPESKKATDLIKSAPVSSGFENSTYNSLNAFRFINGEGKVTAVRWSMAPVQPFEPLPEKTPAGKNYLFDQLIAAAKKQPLRWHLVITVAEPGDPTNDATLPWPPGRKQVDVGMLTVERVESEERSPARDINFDPLILPDGIEGSDDPLLSARSAAYSRSFTRREGETKEPSAVSPAETGR